MAVEIIMFMILHVQWAYKHLLCVSIYTFSDCAEVSGAVQDSPRGQDL